MGGDSGSFTEGTREAATDNGGDASAGAADGEQPVSYCENVARVCGAAQPCLQQTSSVVTSGSQCVGDACQSVYGAVGSCGRCLLPASAATDPAQQTALVNTFRQHMALQEQ
eukprot:5057962-Prymnesium_polylepis.1